MAGNGSGDVILAFTFGVTFLAAILAVAAFVRDPSPLLVTIIKVTLALAAAGVAATVPGFLSVSFSPMAAVAVRAGGAIAVFVVVFFFTPAGLVPTSGKAPPKPPLQVHTIVTPWLGLQFKQEGRVLPIFDDNNMNVVKLLREAFTITVPERTWQSRTDNLPALQIIASANPDLVRLVRFGGSGEANPFFQPGTGLADYEHGSGRLWAVTSLSDRPFSHNYIRGSRFNVDDLDRRGLYVSAIVTDSPPEQNLMQTAAKIYMVFHVDASIRSNKDISLAPRILDRSNVDIVMLDFE